MDSILLTRVLRFIKSYYYIYYIIIIFFTRLIFFIICFKHFQIILSFILGVTSEGEKSQVVVEDIEEGCEAEASEAGTIRSSPSVSRGSGTARRSNRQILLRSRSKPPPQRITWDESGSSVIERG